MYGEAVKEVFYGMIKLALVGAIIIGFVIFFVTKATYKTNKVESKTLITPEIRLTTDGKTVDTVYVYKTK